jgi:protease II
LREYTKRLQRDTKRIYKEIAERYKENAENIKNVKEWKEWKRVEKSGKVFGLCPSTPSPSQKIPQALEKFFSETSQCCFLVNSARLSDNSTAENSSTGVKLPQNPGFRHLNSQLNSSSQQCSQTSVSA